MPYYWLCVFSVLTYYWAITITLDVAHLPYYLILTITLILLFSY